MESTQQKSPEAELGDIVVVGAGPAGLTAAYELLRHGVRSKVLESDSVVGGISRTVEADGWRFDIGGHRFFTKVAAVEDHEHRGDQGAPRCRKGGLGGCSHRGR